MQFGIPLGEMKNFPTGLRKGLVRDGAKESVAGVGVESLHGRAGDQVYARILALYDRGKFVGVVAIGRTPGDREVLPYVIDQIQGVTGAKPVQSSERMFFECETGIDLSLERTTWEGKPHFVMTLTDRDATAQMQNFVRDYCADPKRRRPQDACK